MEKIKVFKCFYFHRRKLELVDQYGFISKIGEKLSIFDLTMATYNALFEVSLTSSSQRQILLFIFTMLFYIYVSSYIQIQTKL